MSNINVINTCTYACTQSIISDKENSRLKWHYGECNLEIILLEIKQAEEKSCKSRSPSALFRDKVQTCIRMLLDHIEKDSLLIFNISLLL